MKILLKCPKPLQYFLFVVLTVAGITLDWYTNTSLSSVYLLIVIFAGLIFDKFWIHLLICVLCTLLRYFPFGEAHIHFFVIQSHLQYIAVQLIAYQLISGLLSKIKKEANHSKEMEEKYRSIAYHDILTGLPNRLNFHDTLERTLNNAKLKNEKIALFFLDLNRFKSINDSLGHHAGDLLLKEVAQRLQACLNEQEMIFRLGGDEFTVISKINNADDAPLLAEKMIKQFNHPVLINNRQCFISTSIGISLYPHDGRNAEELIKCSDAAMYMSKDRGSNIYTFYSSDIKQQENVLFLESDLRRALKENQFTVLFQPKYNISKNKLDGLEALVRWVHPELGVIPPFKFIPFAEQTGMIVPLGELVLNMVCRQINAWKKEGVNIPRIAINLSAKQFKQDNLADMIENILESFTVEPGLIEIEITESAIIYDENKSIGTINRLKEMGIRFSIDDFGTGYSSLSYLKKFPVDALKIDQSFVRDIGRKGDNAIVASIITLADHLGLDVVAEGVENMEQLRFLHEHGCKVIQGFLVSKPLTADEVLPIFLHNFSAAAG